MGEKINHENEQHRASDEQLVKAREILDGAKREGKIDWTETGEEFALKFKEREIHIPKWEKTSLLNNISGEMSQAPLEKVIKAFLANPEVGEKGRIKKTIEEIDKREKADKIENDNTGPVV